MLETVRRALGRPDRPSKLYECRHCGTGLRGASEQCPSCESTEIAVYDL